MTPRTTSFEELWKWSAAPLDWPAWGEDAARAIWSVSGPLDVQPIHALHDAALLGAEARGGHGWTKAARNRLTALLLHMACDEAVLWRSLPGMTPLTVSVRLPAAPCHLRLVDQVEGALTCTGLPAGLLELGLSLDADAPAGPRELLAWSALRDMGVGLSVEFAPGMAARTLGRLPFTCLRLPPCLADGVEDSPAMRRHVRDVVRAAHGQAACVLATSVRTALQRDILLDLGCTAVQGPLFGLPMHPAVFQAVLAEDAVH